MFTAESDRGITERGARSPAAGVIFALLYVVGLLLPLYSSPGTSVVARVALALAVAPAFAALLRRPLLPERQWIGRVALLFAAFLSSAVVVVIRDPEAAFAGDGADLGRQAFILAGACLLPAMLRSESRRRLFGVAMTLVGMVASATILYAYLEFAGLRLVSLTELASFKFFADRSVGIAVNPVSFAAALALAMGAPSWWPRRAYRIVVLVLGVSAVVLSGARTTVVSVAAAALLVPVVRLTARQRGRARMAVMAAVTMALLAVAVTIIDLMASLDGETASVLTTGRYDLWIAALGQFSAHPLFGSGVTESFVGIAAYLPGFYRWGSEALVESAGTGGYHNAYLALLTQRGIVGFSAGAVLLTFVVRRAFQLASRRSEFGWRDAQQAGIAPFVMLGIVLRGLGEQPGFFGAANGLVDFLVFAAAAQVVALAAATGSAPRRSTTDNGGAV